METKVSHFPLRDVRSRREGSPLPYGARERIVTERGRREQAHALRNVMDVESGGRLFLQRKACTARQVPRIL